MPNRLQVTFLASFIATFGFLAVISHLASNYLKSKGYDISRLILIGLEDSENMSIPQNIDLPYFGNTDLIALANSPAFALTCALLTAAGIYLAVSQKGSKKVLNPTQWQNFPLIKKTAVSPNTAVYRFGLPQPNDILGLPIGQHIFLSAHINGKDVTRKYTPISSDDDKGYFDLLIKSYDLGNISKHVGQLQIGQTVKVKGPNGQFTYSKDLTSAIGMIAGGTGITPMMQVIRAALKDASDATKISLIYANVNHEDILLKTEIDTLAQQHAHRFTVRYVLNNPPPNWQGGVGFVSQDHIKQHIPAATTESKVILCGPPPMMTAMKKHLADLDYPAPRTISKLGDKVFLF